MSKTIHELDEFLDDEKFITEQHKKIYLEKGKYLSTKQKNIIKEKFECYYESFKFFGTKKGKQQIILGDELEQHKQRIDNRTTRQATEIANITKQAIINFLADLCERSESDLELNSKIENGYYYTTSFNFLFEFRLVKSSFKEFVRKVEYPSADEFFEELERFNNDDDLEKQNRQDNKSYIKVKKYRWNRTFRQALKTFETKDNYVVTTWNKYTTTEDNEEKEVNYLSHRLMTDDEKEILKRNDTEKSSQFKKKTDKTEMYDLLIADYISEKFNAFSVYKVLGIKLEQQNDVNEINTQAFLSDFKTRTDKKSITALYKSCSHSIHALDYEHEYRKQELIDEFLNDIKTTDTLDEYLINATRSNETQELINDYVKRLRDIEIVNEFEMITDEQLLELLNEME